MVARMFCGALHGVSAFRVDLEVDLTRQGLPSFALVGLPDNAVREARERVSSALRSSGFKLPPAKITVNLAPADRRKAGSAYDLPLAIALLGAAGMAPPEALAGWFLAGELSLTGELKAVSGILPLAVLARDLGARGMIVPPDNAAEAAVVEGLSVYTAPTLIDCVAFLLGNNALSPVHAAPTSANAQASLLDFSEVKGQEHAKRAIEIAAAGAHNLLFIGPPGSGKTMLAERISSVLPPLAFDEALEVTRIYSVAGMLNGHGLIATRPFRAPHHTISQAALVGGGAYPRPGEVSLAHRGVLFLDELPEYQKNALEVLRQPLESGEVTVARANQHLSFPADCMLVAAMNPCPCGFRTDPRHSCTCTAQQIERYRTKLSGPLLDRIDLHVEVPAVSYEDLRARKAGADSATMRSRIAAARAIQATRYAGTPCRTNADLNGQLLDTYCRLDHEGHDFLRQAVQALALSARAYTRILRISRTLADLDATPDLNVSHVAEAISCRTLDRTYL